jgi:hypothetical protein
MNQRNCGRQPCSMASGCGGIRTLDIQVSRRGWVAAEGRGIAPLLHERGGIGRVREVPFGKAGICQLHCLARGSLGFHLRSRYQRLSLLVVNLLFQIPFQLLCIHFFRHPRHINRNIGGASAGTKSLPERGCDFVFLFPNGSLPHAPFLETVRIVGFSKLKRIGV